MVSAGISEEGIGKSEDSNHEPMISASSNHKLTPSQNNNMSHNQSHSMLEQASPPLDALIVKNQGLGEERSKQFRLTMGEIDSGTPSGLFEFRKEQVKRAAEGVMNNIGASDGSS